MKQRGFTLVEMLVMLPVIVAAGALFTFILPVAVRDVPRLQQTLSYHRQIQGFLTRLQADVDSASLLPAQIGSATAGESILLLQTPDGALAYELHDGKMIRKSLAGASTADTTEWYVPGAAIEFHPWTRDNKTYAVDVHTVLSIQREGKTVERFENHHVFFLHAMPTLSIPKEKS